MTLESDKVRPLEKIYRDHENETRIKVRWFYWPEETVMGRRNWNGVKELYYSDHRDDQSAETITGKIFVHTLHKYTKLKEVNDEDYYSIALYHYKTRAFTPKFRV